jgi:hypothetical protein
LFSYLIFGSPVPSGKGNVCLLTIIYSPSWRPYHARWLPRSRRSTHFQELKKFMVGKFVSSMFWSLRFFGEVLHVANLRCVLIIPTCKRVESENKERENEMETIQAGSSSRGPIATVRVQFGAIQSEPIFFTRPCGLRKNSHRLKRSRSICQSFYCEWDVYSMFL